MKIEEVKEGQSVKYKFKATTYFLIYEKDMEWYRCERSTSKTLEYSYFMYKELPIHYNLRSSESGISPEIELLNDEEITDRNMLYRGLKYKTK